MRWAARLLPFVLVVAACSPSSQPATTPATVATTTATTTTVAVTTTLDRLAEIEAIYQDLEERRLDALYRGDREAFRALFANDAYRERSMGAFDLEPFEQPPVVTTVVTEVVVDEADCLAAWIGGTIDGVDAGALLMVLQPTGPNAWGYAYGGEGWLCDGPHPLES